MGFAALPVPSLYMCSYNQMKNIEQMSDEELQAELDRLQSIPIPAERRAGAPARRRTDVKPRARKSSWKDAIFGDADGAPD